MRKTQLWFQKEQTPEYYNAKVTYDGRLNNISPIVKKSILGRAKRFPQYEHDANRLGKDLGPGYYPQFHKCIFASKTRGTPIYKKFYRQRDLTDNWYFFINQSPIKNDHLRKTF